MRLLLNDYEEQSSDWLWQADADGRVVSPSRRFIESAGGALEPGMRFDSLFDPRPATDTLRKALQEGKAFRNLVLQCQIAGETKWWRISGRPTFDVARRYVGMEGVAADVTETRLAEARINYMAHHDALTGLPNRFLLNETMSGVLERRKEHEPVGLIYLDLDDFKLINDTLGHAVGDGVLSQVSRRIEEKLHAGDMVARLGGDEFAVLLSACSTPERAATVAASILEILKEPMQIGERQVFTGASIGMAFAPQDGAEPGDLLRSADLALYWAKANGRNRAAAFTPEMQEAMLERRSLEHDLRLAMSKGELAMHYQPLVDTASGQIVAYEALMRWNHPIRGMIMPNHFISLAEENGLIVQLGEWALRQALDDVAHWPSHLRVAVNLSPIQLRSSGLKATVINALAATGVEPSRLELEITENVLLQESELVLDTLHQLRKLGVRIALDDFGTGFSSLNYLRSFPFDKIKIDRSFVTHIAANGESLAIVRAVIGLATSLGMKTTAEGVETAEQLERLRTEGVTEVQGYLFSAAQQAKTIAESAAAIHASASAQKPDDGDSSLAA